GQRLAGHGPVIDKAVRQLEAGRRHPLERLVQSWRRVTHVVLLAAAACEPPGQPPVPAADSPLARILPARSRLGKLPGSADGASTNRPFGRRVVAGSGDWSDRPYRYLFVCRCRISV